MPRRIEIEIAANDRCPRPDAACAERAVELYRTFCHGALIVTDAASAEMTKLADVMEAEVGHAAQALADSYRAELVRAARLGLQFYPATGETSDMGGARAGDRDLVLARGGVRGDEMAVPGCRIRGPAWPTRWPTTRRC